MAICRTRSGWSKSLKDLISDARLWLYGTQEEVMLFIVVANTEFPKPESRVDESSDAEDEDSSSGGEDDEDGELVDR
jgi:hypothetical protein